MWLLFQKDYSDCFFMTLFREIKSRTSENSEQHCCDPGERMVAQTKQAAVDGERGSQILDVF